MTDDDEYDDVQSASPPPPPTNRAALYGTQHDLFRSLAAPVLSLLVILAALVLLWDPTPLPPVPAGLPPGTTPHRIPRTPTESLVLALRDRWPAGPPGIVLFVAACLGTLALLRVGIAVVAAAATGFRELRDGREVRVGRGGGASAVTGEDLLSGLFVR